jgi:hypothetical protein
VLLFSALILESTIGMSLNGIEIQRASKGKQRILAYGGTIDSYEPDLRSGNNLGVVTNYIIINGTQTYVIANGTYTLNETIIVVEFARLIVENATVTFNTTDYIVITSYDNTIVEITNSEINHAQGAQLHSRLFSAVSVTNSTVDSLISYEDADASITKSTLDIVHGYGSSVVSIIDTEIRFVGGHDTSSVSVVNSIVNTVYTSDYAMVSVDNSTVNFIVDVYQFSAVSLTNSTINKVCVYGLSAVLIANSVVDFIDGSGSSDFSVVNSTIGLLSCWHASVADSIISEVELRFYGESIVLVSLPKVFVDYWRLGDLIIQNSQISNWTITGYGSSIISVINSTISDVIGYLSSLISLTNSIVNNVFAYESSVVQLVNSAVYGSINVFDYANAYVGWYLDVLVIDGKGSPLPNAPVKVYWENGTLLTGTTTDDEGLARFILYEKIVNATGTFPYGNYTVKAAYDGYTCRRVIKSITKNMKITVIPWICIYHHGLIYGIYTEWVVVILPGSRPIRIPIR